MAKPIEIRITNLPQIKSAFSRAPGLMRDSLNNAIKKSIITIQRDSMINTPVLTGRLRSSTRSLFSDMRGEVGTHTNYDVFIHEGTKYMRARPYLRQAVESNVDEVSKFFTEAVDDVLSKIGKAT